MKNSNNPLKTIYEEQNQNQKQLKSKKDEKSETQLDLGKQYSRAGIQSNLIFFTNNFQSTQKITPKRHFTSPQDKQRRLQNLPQKIDSSQIPSAVFKSIERSSSFNKENEKNIQQYEPKYQAIKPNPISYTIPPHQQVFPRQRVYSPPECILRGNTCDQEIRKLIIQMKKKTEKITKLQEQLHSIEVKITQSQQEENIHDIGKKNKKTEDGFLNERRKIAEDILEQERIFQNDRIRYNELVEQNLDLLEIKELNLIPEKMQSHIPTLDYERIQGRGQLFNPTSTLDSTEQHFNNYQDFQPKSKLLGTFDQQLQRKPLHQKKENVDFYTQQQQQYLNNQTNKTPFTCLVNIKKQQPKKLMKKIEQNKKDHGMKILEVTKNAYKIPDIKGYVDTSKQIDREIPNSNQMRVIPAQMNFYNRWKSNSPLKYQQQLEIQQKQLEKQQKEKQIKMEKLQKKFLNSNSLSPAKFRNIKLEKINEQQSNTQIQQQQQQSSSLDLQQNSKPTEQFQTQTQQQIQQTLDLEQSSQ